MTWEAWVLFTMFSLGALSATAMVGKPREPMTNEVAMVTILICALEGYLLLRLAGVF